MHIDFIQLSRWPRVTDPDLGSCQSCQMVMGVICKRSGSVTQGHREKWVKSMCTSFGEECAPINIGAHWEPFLFLSIIGVLLSKQICTKNYENLPELRPTRLRRNGKVFSHQQISFAFKSITSMVLCFVILNSWIHVSVYLFLFNCMHGWIVRHTPLESCPASGYLHDLPKTLRILSGLWFISLITMVLHMT